MLHNVAAATLPAAFVREPAKAEAYSGTALYVRLLGHGHGGTVDWNQTNDPCSPWSALHNACMGLPASCVMMILWSTQKWGVRLVYITWRTLVGYGG